MGRWDHGNVRCQRTFPTWTCHVPPPPPDVGTFGADVGPPPPPDVGTLGAHVGGGGGTLTWLGGRCGGDVQWSLAAAHWQARPPPAGASDGAAGTPGTDECRSLSGPDSIGFGRCATKQAVTARC